MGTVGGKGRALRHTGGSGHCTSSPPLPQQVVVVHIGVPRVHLVKMVIHRPCLGRLSCLGCCCCRCRRRLGSASPGSSAPRHCVDCCVDCCFDSCLSGRRQAGQPGDQRELQDGQTQQQVVVARGVDACSLGWVGWMRWVVGLYGGTSSNVQLPFPCAAKVAAGRCLNPGQPTPPFHSSSL